MLGHSYWISAGLTAHRPAKVSGIALLHVSSKRNIRKSLFWISSSKSSLEKKCIYSYIYIAPVLVIVPPESAPTAEAMALLHAFEDRGIREVTPGRVFAPAFCES